MEKRRAQLTGRPIRSVGGALGTTLLAAAILGAGPAIVSAADHLVIVRSEPSAFDAARLTVAVGDTVTWQVAPGTVHTVTSGTYNASGVHPDGAFDSGSLTPGEEFSHTFAAVGEFPYVCAIHADSGMVGRITVTAGGPAQSPDRSPAPPAPTGGEESFDAIGGVLIATVLALAALTVLGWRARSGRRA